MFLVIVRANKIHKNVLLEYCRREPDYNLFAIGDLMSFSLGEDFMDVFIEVDQKPFRNEKNALDLDKIQGLVLRYYENLLPISYLENYGFNNILELLSRTHKKKFNYSGKPATIREMLKFFSKRSDYEYRETFFCNNQELKTIDGMRTDLNTARLKCEDIEDYRNLLQSIFPESLQPSQEAIENNLETNSSRYYVIKKGNKIVSSAATGIETPISAMIIAVMTRPEYQNQGFATAVIYQLCKDLLKEGRTPYLFYDNPQAGRIYKKIGFEDIGKYALGTVQF